MDARMQRVIEQFPELTTAIHDRFRDDQNFRDMCGDYTETLEALQRWQASKVPHRAARIEEYRELAEALESEIIAALRHPTQDMEDRPR